MTESDAIARVDAAMAAGDALAGYDLALECLQVTPNSVGLQHRLVLALARTGALAEARRRYDQWRLGEMRSPEPRLDTDLAALGARLAKDAGLRARIEDRARLFRHAAALYAAAHQRSGSVYPLVNAAALHLWAGDRRAAERLAAEALDAETGDDFYAHATRAECHLLQGRAGQALHQLGLAAAAGGDQQARAVTRRQLRRSCDILGIGAELLAPIKPETIVRFAGHMPGKRFPPELEAAASAGISGLLDQLDASVGYGPLAAGADILFAEALLARGGELNVVLPFAVDEFKRVSVAPSGEAWLARFEACMARAQSLRLASRDLYLGDNAIFALGSDLASGLALLRGQTLDAPVVQVAIWDGKPPDSPGGTAEEILRWHARGLPQHLLRPNGMPFTPTSWPRWTMPVSQPGAREMRPVIFGDAHGFCGLHETQARSFVTHVLGGLSKAIAPMSDRILHRNSWGDGVFLVLDTVEAAAAAALAMQDQLHATDLATLQLPATLAMRFGAHYGPATRMEDPLTGRDTWIGPEINRAARIEPVTPPGAVYVSESFAAALALDAGGRFAADYAGQMDTAKGAGKMPLFALRHAT